MTIDSKFLRIAHRKNKISQTCWEHFSVFFLKICEVMSYDCSQIIIVNIVIAIDIEHLSSYRAHINVLWYFYLDVAEGVNFLRVNSSHTPHLGLLPTESYVTHIINNQHLYISWYFIFILVHQCLSYLHFNSYELGQRQLVSKLLN
jgi:hypothetical protein